MFSRRTPTRYVLLSVSSINDPSLSRGRGLLPAQLPEDTPAVHRGKKRKIAKKEGVKMS